MGLSYSLSIIIIFLALFGAWEFARTVWKYIRWPKMMNMPPATFLIFIRNMEQEVEHVVRYLISELEYIRGECDIVIVDLESTDLTPAILGRLASEHAVLKVVRQPWGASRPFPAVLPLCQGAVIHVFDLITRVKLGEFYAAVAALIRMEDRDIFLKTEE